MMGDCFREIIMSALHLHSKMCAEICPCFNIDYALDFVENLYGYDYAE